MIIRTSGSRIRLSGKIFSGQEIITPILIGDIFRLVTSNTNDALEYQSVDGTVTQVDVFQNIPVYILTQSGSLSDTPSTGVFGTIVATKLLITSSVNDFIFQEELITTTGAGTWTKPAGVDKVVVECWGGGGSGGGATGTNAGGGGGAPGQYVRKLVTYNPTSSNISYSVAASVAGSTGNGITGNDTTWQTNVVVAKGGAPGLAPVLGSGSPGIASSAGAVGDIIYIGGDGGEGFFNSPTTAVGGSGGSPPGSTGQLGEIGVEGKEYGGAKAEGLNVLSSGQDGNPGNNYAGGGGGAAKISGANRNGGSGAQGLIRLIYTIGPQLSADPQNSKSYPGSGTSWYDLSFNNFTGSLFNSPTYTSTSPANFSFNGTSQYATFPYSGSQTDSFTIAGWVKIPTTGEKTFISRGRNSSGNGWSLYLGTDINTTIVFGVTTTTPSTVSAVLTGSIALQTDTWYFLAGVWNAGVSQEIYVNNIPDAFGNNTGTNLRTSTDGIAIASLSTTTFSDISIGNFKVYNRVLTEQQLNKIYENELSRYP